MGALGLTALWFLAPKASEQFSEEGVVEIQYMAPEGPIQEAMEDAVREFELLSRRRNKETNGAYPIYKVVAGQHASANQVEDPTRFILSLVGGEPPDVIFFDRFAISEWASRGTFLPLDSYIKKDAERWNAWQNTGGPMPWPGAEKEAARAAGAEDLPAIKPIRQDDFYPGAWHEAIFTDPLSGESGLYGVPNNADNRVLLYNKDILVRHGFVDANGEAKPPTNWKELAHMAKAMTEYKKDGSIKTVGFIPNFGDAWLYMYGWQNGSEFMANEGKAVTLNHPANVKALEFMTSIYDSVGGIKNVAAFQNTFQGDALDPFITGKVAMKIDGVWIMSSLARYGRDLNVGAAPPPLPQTAIDAGRKPISWLGGWAYAIPSSSQKAEGAWELIRFLSSKRALQIMLTSENYAYQAQGRPFLPRQYPNREHNEWAYRRYVEANPDLAPKFKSVMRQFNDLLEHSLYRPVTPIGQKLWTSQKSATDDALYHKKTPQESLDYYNNLLQRDLDRILYPSEGTKITNWNTFLILYGLLVILVMWLAYLWDTKNILKRLCAKLPFIGKKIVTGEDSAGLEGSSGSYFRSQWKEGIICALPWIIGFIVFTGGPLLFSIVISFCRYDVLQPATFTGLENYRFMFEQDELFWVSFKNTIFMVIGIPLGLAVGLGIALLLTREVRGVALWRTFFYLPSIVPVVASSILWIWIFNPQSGMLNQLLAGIGVQGPHWLQDPETSKWSLLLMGLWGAGGGMIIWIAGIKGISKSYYEAASIDGANSLQQFTYITIPMLTPYIFFNMIMGLIGTFQIFEQSFIMTSGGPVNSTLFYVYHLFNHAFRYLNMGYAASMAWFLFVIVLILTIIQMQLSKRWVHYEGS